MKRSAFAHVPSSKLLRILPESVLRTRARRLARNAEIESIISTAFPKVTFTKAPSVSFVFSAISSVARLRCIANGIIPRKQKTNTNASSIFKTAAAIPSGTKNRSTFREVP